MFMGCFGWWLEVQGVRGHFSLVFNCICALPIRSYWANCMVGLTNYFFLWVYKYPTMGSSLRQRLRLLWMANQIDQTPLFLSVLLLSLFFSFSLFSVQPLFSPTFPLFIAFLQWVSNDCFLTILVRVGPIWIIPDRGGPRFRNRNLNIGTSARRQMVLGGDIP